MWREENHGSGSYNGKTGLQEGKYFTQNTLVCHQKNHKTGETFQSLVPMNTGGTGNDFVVTLLPWLKPGASVPLWLSSLSGCHDHKANTKPFLVLLQIARSGECNTVCLSALFCFSLSLSSLFPQELPSDCSFSLFRTHRFLNIIPLVYWLILVISAYRQIENSQVFANELAWQAWLLVACISILKSSLISCILIIISLLG